MCLFPYGARASSHFYDKGPHLLLWAVSRAVRGKMAISGISDSLNCCEIFIIYERGRLPHNTTWWQREARGPRVGGL